MSHHHDLVAPRTDRLVLRPWRVRDAVAALRTYHGSCRVPDLASMRVLLEQWLADDGTAPAGRWAIERRHDHRIIGGASLLPLPPGNHDLGIAWQLDPEVAHLDHDDHVAEIAATLASWAFDHCVDEVFAVVPPDDTRTAANIGRCGMRWVGETTKYFGLDRQIYRLRPADLLGASTVRDTHTVATVPRQRATDTMAVAVRP